MASYHKESYSCYEVMVDASAYETPANISEKIDNILSVVQKIDQRLKSQSHLPSIPTTNTEPPHSTFRFSDRASSLYVKNLANRNKPSITDTRLPPVAPPPLPRDFSPTVPRSTAACISPPVPPKPDSIIQPQVNNDGSMTFTASQCLCLTLQIKAVKIFIDDNFEDDYVDKEINMAVLNAIIRTLNGKKSPTG